MIYKLSETGRQVTYSEWRKFGGCGVPNSSNAMNGNLGPMADWVIWVPLIPVAAAIVWIGFTLFIVWIVICIMFGLVDDDD